MDEVFQLTGVCKECLEDVPINMTTQVGAGVWECPHCDYPHNIYDFHDIWNKKLC